MVGLNPAEHLGRRPRPRDTGRGREGLTPSRRRLGAEGLGVFYHWLLKNYPDEEQAERWHYNYTDEENFDFWKQYIPLLLASEADSG